MEVLPGVYQIGATWANVVLLAGRDIVLVDTGWRGSGRRILRFVDEIGRVPQDISTIVVTHHHPDHMGSLADLQRASGARVAAHVADAPYVSGDLARPPGRRRPVAGALRRIVDSEPARVDVVLKDGDRLGESGETIVVHSPGHTAGSISLFVPAKKLLIVGDVMNNSRGRLSFPPRIVCHDYGQAKESVRKLLDLDFDTLCCGHGPPLLHGAADAVRGLVAGGLAEVA